MNNEPLVHHAVLKRLAGMVRSAFSTMLVLFIVFMAPPASVSAGEAGFAIEVREIGRNHTDSETIGSKISYRQAGISVKRSFFDGLVFQYVENRREWKLSHPDGTRYFSIDSSSHVPELDYGAGDWKFKIAVPVVDVNRQNRLYSAIAQDDRDRFILPALTARFEMKDLYIKGGGWQETDIQAFNQYRYSLFVYETYFVEVGKRLALDHDVSANIGMNRRIYPADYDLEKNLYTLSYRFHQPAHLSDHFEWQFFSVAYTNTVYSDVDTKKLVFANNFRFRLWGIGHFLSHHLKVSDTVTTYQEGPLKYALLETDEQKSDIAQVIDYAGFIPIDSSRFFLSWRYAIEDSLSQNVFLDQRLEIKVTYPF